jgi:uncharacterized membrane protein YfcA
MSSDTVLFMSGAFVAALAAGLAGFAFALIASALWLHVVPPLQAVPLIIASALTIQAFSIWQLRRSIRYDRLWPIAVGGILGVPLGVAALRFADPHLFRLAVGAFLVLYSLLMLLRPPLRAISGGGRLADSAAGVLGGALGGFAGFNGMVATIWCDLRGWPKADQRGIYQPFIIVTHVVALALLGGLGSFAGRTIELYLLALPALLLGGWIGLRLYGLVDDRAFRRIILVMLLVSGVLLLV